MRSRLWLLLPVAALYAADVGLTLAGQPEAYWAGDYTVAVEANPIAFFFLARSPWLFLGSAVVWLVLVSAMVWTWRHPVAAWMAVGIAVVHTIGGACWLLREYGLLVAGVYIAVAAQLSAWCWRRYSDGQCSDERGNLDGARTASHTHRHAPR